MSPTKHENLQHQVKELVSKGMVRPSSSPCADPPYLYQRKIAHFKYDSHAINKITITYRFPIPQIDNLFDQLGGATKVMESEVLRKLYPMYLDFQVKWAPCLVNRNKSTTSRSSIYSMGISCAYHNAHYEVVLLQKII